MPQFTRPHSNRCGRRASCQALRPAFLHQARKLQTRFAASFGSRSGGWDWELPASSHATASPFSPLSKSISSSVCCIPGTAPGCEQQEPSAHGCGAAISAAQFAAGLHEVPTSPSQDSHLESVVDLRVPPSHPDRPIRRLDLSLATNDSSEEGWMGWVLLLCHHERAPEAN